MEMECWDLTLNRHNLTAVAEGISQNLDLYHLLKQGSGLLTMSARLRDVIRLCGEDPKQDDSLVLPFISSQF